MIEQELRALAAFVDFPGERDLEPAVRARLTPRRRRGRALVVVLAAVLLAIGIAFAVPPARSAILRFLHLQGVTIEFVDSALERVTVLDDTHDLDFFGVREHLPDRLPGQEGILRDHYADRPLLRRWGHVNHLSDPDGFEWVRSTMAQA